MKVTAIISNSYVKCVGQGLREFLDKLRQTVSLDVLYFDGHYSITGAWCDIQRAYKSLTDKLPKTITVFNTSLLMEIDDEHKKVLEHIADYQLQDFDWKEKKKPAEYTTSLQDVEKSGPEISKVIHSRSMKSMNSYIEQKNDAVNADFVSLTSNTSIGNDVIIKTSLGNNDPIVLPSLADGQSVTKNIASVQFAKLEINAFDYLENFYKKEIQQLETVFEVDIAKSKLNDTFYIVEIRRVKHNSEEDISEAYDKFLNLYESVKQNIVVDTFDASKFKDVFTVRKTALKISAVYDNVFIKMKTDKQLCLFIGEPLAVRDAKLAFIQMFSSYSSRSDTSSSVAQQMNNSASTCKSALKGSNAISLARRCASLDSPGRVVTFGPTQMQELDPQPNDSNTSITTQRDSMCSATRESDILSADGSQLIANTAFNKLSQTSYGKQTGNTHPPFVPDNLAENSNSTKIQESEDSSEANSSVSMCSEEIAHIMNQTQNFTSATIPIAPVKINKRSPDELEAKLAEDKKYSYSEKLAMMQRSITRPIVPRVTLRSKASCSKKFETNALSEETVKLSYPGSQSLAEPIYDDNAIVNNIADISSAVKNLTENYSLKNIINTKISSTTVTHTDSVNQLTVISSKAEIDSVAHCKSSELLQQGTDGSVNTLSDSESSKTLSDQLSTTTLISSKTDHLSQHKILEDQNMLSNITESQNNMFESNLLTNYEFAPVIAASVDGDNEEHSNRTTDSYNVSLKKTLKPFDNGYNDKLQQISSQGELPIAISKEKGFNEECTNYTETKENFVANQTFQLESKAILESIEFEKLTPNNTMTIKEELTCVICLHSVENDMKKNIFQCGHIFCQACAEWLVKDPSYNFSKTTCLTCSILKKGLLITQPKDGTLSRIIDTKRDVMGYKGYGSILLQISFKSGFQEKVKTNKYRVIL